MKAIKKLSIIGGTGNLGVPVVKFLLKEGFEIRLIVRNKNKAMELFGSHPAMTLAEADLKDVSQLRTALTDTEYLYLNLSTEATDINIPFSTEREGIKNILEAINRQSVKQIITISGMGAFDNVYKQAGSEFAPNIIRKQGHKLLKNSGIPYTILHCSWFADSFVVYLRNNTYSIIGDTTNPIYFVNCYDYTRHIINALGNPEACFREFPVQGKEAYTHPDAAGTFLDIYSKQAKAKPFPVSLIRLMALFNKEMKYLKHMNDYFSSSKDTFLAEEFDTYKILGYPSLNLRQYAELLLQEKIYVNR